MCSVSGYTLSQQQQNHWAVSPTSTKTQLLDTMVKRVFIHLRLCKLKRFALENWYMQQYVNNAAGCWKSWRETGLLDKRLQSSFLTFQSLSGIFGRREIVLWVSFFSLASFALSLHQSYHGSYWDSPLRPRRNLCHVLILCVCTISLNLN